MNNFLRSLAFLFVSTSFAASSYLVTLEEMRASNEAPLQLSPRSRHAPCIDSLTIESENNVCKKFHEERLLSISDTSREA